MFRKTEAVCYERRSHFTDAVVVSVLNDLLGHVTMFSEKYLKRDLDFFTTIEETAKSLLMKQPVQKVSPPTVEATITHYWVWDWR
jgi:hypothetical protein